MSRFLTSSVAEVLAEREGLQRVALDGGDRAVVLTQLTGPVQPGDVVVVNTTAVDLGLGTGGWHVVHWNLSREAWDGPGSGHIMKLRYTSLQADTGAAEEAFPSETWPDLGGRPIVACGLHSQVGVIAAVLAELAPAARVVYVMTDGAALPAALSDLVAALRDQGLLAATITAGNAFGGDLEAVSTPSGLELAVRVAGADVVVAGMGPGVVGTGTPLGTTAVEVAAIADAGSAIGGRSIVTARASLADPRARHLGLSHHTDTALRLAARPVTVAHAAGTPPIRVPVPHEVITVAAPDVGALLGRRALRVTTMGRGPADDPVFFATTAAAAVLAVRWHDERTTVRP